MTRVEILAIAALAFAFAPMLAAMGLVGSTDGSQKAGARRRLSRLNYALRTVGLVALQAAAVAATFHFEHHNSSKGAGSLWLATFIWAGKWSALRLNDAGIRNRTLAVLTGIPVFGFLVMIYLATLPSDPDARSDSPNPDSPRTTSTAMSTSQVVDARHSPGMTGGESGL